MTLAVWVVGAEGQLGMALRDSLPPEVTWLQREGGWFDIRDAAAVRATAEQLRPQLIINAAAYTAVDRAESEPELAHQVNCEAAATLARAAASVGARMVQVSTDFVFDGQQGRPYRPEDPTAPLSVYGRTKRDGERVVQDLLGEHALVVRTAWLYYPGGANFVRTMLRLLAERPELRVVADQVGTPTHAGGLAAAIWTLVSAHAGGVHHWTDAGAATWYDFAEAIREVAQTLAPETSWGRVVPVRTEDYPTPAERPRYGLLDKTATWAVTGVPPHWRLRLAGVLRATGVSGF